MSSPVRSVTKRSRRSLAGEKLEPRGEARSISEEFMSDPIVTYLQQHLEEYVADLRYLSAIDSGTDDKAGVDTVQDWLMERMRRFGFSVERRPQERWGDRKST